MIWRNTLLIALTGVFMHSANAQVLMFAESLDVVVLPFTSLSGESVERLEHIGDDVLVVTRQSVFKTRVLRSSNGMWTESFRYGTLDSNIVFSGYQNSDDGVLRFPCLTRNSMLTAAHGTYAVLSVMRDGNAQIDVQQDTFRMIRTGTSSVASSSHGHLMCARQRGGVQLPANGSHLLYQFDASGVQRVVGAIDAGAPDDVDGGFSIACFSDGTSVITGVSRFTATEYSQAWVIPFDESITQGPVTTFITDGSERVLATLIESQPQADTVLSYTILKSADADTSILLSFIDRTGSIVHMARLALPSGSAFFPLVIRRHSGTWTAAGYLRVKELGESQLYSAFVRIRLDGENVRSTGYVDRKTQSSSFVSHWIDASGREYLGGYSRAGMMYYPINETVSSVQEPNSTPVNSTPINIINLSQLLWGQASGPSGCVHLYDLLGRHLGEVSSAVEILTKCAQNSLVWVVSADRSWLVTTQQHY